MTKHKRGSASPGLHRDERAGGTVTTSPTTEAAELDTGATIQPPAEDASGQREGMHVKPTTGRGKRRS